MNNIFSARRFGNYFLWDLRNFYSRAFISVLTVSVLPLAFCITELFSLVTYGTTINIQEHFGFGFGIFCMVIALFVLIISVPNKLYGHLTEKQAGTSWLLIPASNFEKWLSMILILCVVLPLVFSMIFFSIDGILALLFSNTYGSAVLSKARGIMDTMNLVYDEFSIEGSKLDFNLAGLSFLNWCESILTFALGAICFKKSKAAKTILCVIAASMVVSSLCVPFFGDMGIRLSILQDADSMIMSMKWGLYAVTILTTIALAVGLWFRIKTLKH